MCCGVKTAPSSKQPYMDTRWKEKERTSNDHLTANGGTRTKKPPPHLGNNRHYGPRPAEVEGFRCCPLRLWRYGHMMMMMESSWVGAACAILRNIEGLGLDKTFWLDPQRLKHCDSPDFFFSICLKFGLCTGLIEQTMFFSIFWLVLEEPCIS